MTEEATRQQDRQVVRYIFSFHQWVNESGWMCFIIIQKTFYLGTMFLMATFSFLLCE